MSEAGDLCTSVVCHANEATATKTYGQRSPAVLTCIELYFFTLHAQCPLYARSNKKARAKSSVVHVVYKNCVQYMSEKVILSSWGRLRPSEAGIRTCIENNYFLTEYAKLGEQ